MIGCRGTVVGVVMAIETIIPQALPAQAGFGIMTIDTGQREMGTYEREAVFFMDLGYLIYQPVF